VATAAQLALPITVLYSELHDLTAFDATEPRRPGSYAVKRIKGARYWYHQRWVGRRRIQEAIGPETPELLARIAEARRATEAWRAESARRRQLVRSLKSVLGFSVEPLVGRVLAQLAEAGAFRAGAVLIGTHAYRTYGAMLGFRLARANLRTGDIDLAAVERAGEAIEISVPDAVQAADDAFFIVPPRPGSRLSTALKQKGGEIRVELLTPLASGLPWQPRALRTLGFAAQQAPYLDYLIEDPVEATYLHADGVRVTVPNPARFGFHKLIVAAGRGPGEQAKRAKDLAQAAELWRVLKDARPGDLRAARKALTRTGRNYVAKALAGTALSETTVPIAATLRA
jgi:hypothetical protein